MVTALKYAAEREHQSCRFDVLQYARGFHRDKVANRGALGHTINLHFSRMIGVAKLAEKLGIGATFPNLTLNLVGGSTLDLPDGLDAKYRIILFYRGHW